MSGGSYHRDEVYLENSKQFRNIFRFTLKKVLVYKKNGSVLEIGSSTGLMLKEFQDVGFEVQGIEPSEKSSKHSINSGIPTLKTTFEKAKLNKKYDVVVLNHVLEHMEDPTKVLEKIYGLLNSKGIVVINVPNAGSLSAKIYGESWEYLLPQEHIWQFTPKTLFGLLEGARFKVVEWSASSGIWEYQNPLLELWQSFIGMKKRFFRNSLTILPTWVISELKLGTGLSIIAQKL